MYDTWRVTSRAARVRWRVKHSIIQDGIAYKVVVYAILRRKVGVVGGRGGGLECRVLVASVINVAIMVSLATVMKMMLV